MNTFSFAYIREGGKKPRDFKLLVSELKFISILYRVLWVGAFIAVLLLDKKALKIFQKNLILFISIYATCNLLCESVLMYCFHRELNMKLHFDVSFTSCVLIVFLERRLCSVHMQMIIN